jgi:hypothetical protein
LQGETRAYFNGTAITGNPKAGSLGCSDEKCKLILACGPALRGDSCKAKQEDCAIG